MGLWCRFERTRWLLNPGLKQAAIACVCRSLLNYAAKHLVARGKLLLRRAHELVVSAARGLHSAGYVRRQG